MFIGKFQTIYTSITCTSMILIRLIDVKVIYNIYIYTVKKPIS